MFTNVLNKVGGGSACVVVGTRAGTRVLRWWHCSEHSFCCCCFFFLLAESWGAGKWGLQEGDYDDATTSAELHAKSIALSTQVNTSYNVMQQDVSRPRRRGIFYLPTTLAADLVFCCGCCGLLWGCWNVCEGIKY